MAKKKKNDDAQQGQLFAPPQNHYSWQPVTLAHRGTIMVVMNEDVTVSNVREENGNIYLSYDDPVSGKHTEQLYTHTDSIYARL